MNLAVVSSLGNAKKVMDDIKAGKCKYDFIEVMACLQFGCIDGGGQPFIRANREILKREWKFYIRPMKICLLESLMKILWLKSYTMSFGRA